MSCPTVLSPNRSVRLPNVSRVIELDPTFWYVIKLEGRFMAGRWFKKHRENSSLLDRIGLRITNVVGTMWCAMLFLVIAVISGPAAFRTHDPVIIVQWISGAFLQLVLLPIIIVGQNQQSKRDEAQSDEDYEVNKKAEKEIEELKQILLNQNAEMADIKKLLNRS